MEKKEENKNITKKQSNILLLIVVLFAFLVSTGVFLSKHLRDTYSASTTTVTFKGANGQALTALPNNGVCTVDSYGFLDPTCAYKLANICRQISEGESVLGGGTNCSDYTPDQAWYKNTADLFTQTIGTAPPRGAYYCMSCTSCTNGCGVSQPQEACYSCTKNGSTVYQVAINATRAKAYAGASSCNSTPVADSNCNAQPEEACYQCTANSTVYKWGTSGAGDSNCSGGYTKTNKSQADCRYVAPSDSCYGCTLGTGTEYAYAASASAAATATGGSNCQAVASSNCTNPPKQCYSCVSNGTTKYTNATSKSQAATNTGGTNCTIVNSSYCTVVPDNPKTGSVAIVFAWIVGLIALGYSIFYAIKMYK